MRPTGTVTLLFSDIEGSTRRLRSVGVQRYENALAQHRQFRTNRRWRGNAWLRGELFMRVVAYFGHHDLLACPTVAVPPYPVRERYPTDINGEALSSYIDWMYLTFVQTLTGCPATSVPIGLTRDGRPVGLQLLGRPRGEFELLAAAQVLEQFAGMASKVPREPAQR